MIVEVGSGPPPRADEVVDEPNCLAVPGLVNAHDHMFQWATRGYVPDGTLVTVNSPAASDMAGRTTPVSRFVAEMEAFGMAPPCASTTVPTMVPFTS